MSTWRDSPANRATIIIIAEPQHCIWVHSCDGIQNLCLCCWCDLESAFVVYDSILKLCVCRWQTNACVFVLATLYWTCVCAGDSLDYLSVGAMAYQICIVFISNQRLPTLLLSLLPASEPDLRYRLQKQTSETDVWGRPQKQTLETDLRKTSETDFRNSPQK